MITAGELMKSSFDVLLQYWMIYCSFQDELLSAGQQRSIDLDVDQ